MEALVRRQPTLKSLSLSKLVKAVQQYGISKDEAREWHRKRDVGEIFRAPKRVKAKLKITGPPGTWQVDVAIMDRGLARKNKGVYRVLLCVDVLSRYALAYPLKKSTASKLIEAFSKFVEDAKLVNQVQCDAGFKTREIEAFFRELDIAMYADTAADDHISKGSDRLGIVDSFTRTLKRMIARYMFENQTTKWLKALPDLIEEYNQQDHPALQDQSPEDVYEDSDLMSIAQKAELERQGNIAAMEANVEVKRGNYVRIRERRGDFARGSAPTWSKQVYYVVTRDGNRFRLRTGPTGRLLPRRFKQNDLLVVREDSGEVDDPTETTANDERAVRRLGREGVFEDRAGAEQAVRRSRRSAAARG